jgi:hypothetical protein
MQMADAVLVRVVEEQARGDLIVVPKQSFHDMAHVTALRFNVIELGSASRQTRSSHTS